MYASANVTYYVQKSITCTKEILDRSFGNLQEKINTYFRPS